MTVRLQQWTHSVLAGLLLVAFASCTKTDTKDAPNRITAFIIPNVPEGKEPIQSVIDDNSNTIRVYLPFHYLMPVISPVITSSEGATVKASEEGSAINVFELYKSGKTLTYTVSPAEGPERTYTVIIDAQQPDLVLNELSPDAANPTVYTMDYVNTTNVGVGFGVGGFNIVPSADLNELLLIDQATKKEYNMADASLGINENPTAGYNVSVYISKFDYNTTNETTMAKSLPEDALYTVKLTSYQKQATLKNPIRIVKKRS
ncbi:MAG: hypothetical protein P0Y53_15260 [Candidatus Pseudobacter hemicellulosilyticus]|uniref:DUF4397 domain-containing protein n=1 Tax=Candidatus Pseudobacter hemicellulosilyticus TaxID=3121375 RepID=A0AAJ6BG85_9BACT|nr:MAG: hypothetical protein P0Y53_15260 [Pseudobacter sp.]